ncbi:hypothetical protein HOLleu_00240 [Holothuria leucospilota]|uniref:Uncharacterized protein n=1 Tax=Holothuria leucospilota TaxID=206669 RepID=A0A9Q1HFQ1_HOLLE|nr:hypothetical protein HOLleu_00240 [Holothuria leucospilota]
MASVVKPGKISCGRKTTPPFHAGEGHQLAIVSGTFFSLEFLAGEAGRKTFVWKRWRP